MVSLVQPRSLSNSASVTPTKVVRSVSGMSDRVFGGRRSDVELSRAETIAISLKIRGVSSCRSCQRSPLISRSIDAWNQHLREGVNRQPATFLSEHDDEHFTDESSHPYVSQLDFSPIVQPPKGPKRPRKVIAFEELFQYGFDHCRRHNTQMSRHFVVISLRSP
jgi:hypothetical protein